MPTIAAIATPPGQGGIAIVRISGPGAKPLLARVFLPHSPHFVNFRPWMLHRGAMLDANDSPLDDVLAVFMPGPRTYTGEDMAEIHCHGGITITNAVLDSFLRLGARLAEPGEFTRRAYLNGRMDLTQAEAVAEMIAAPSMEGIKNSFARLEGRLGILVGSLCSQIDDLRALSRVAIDFPDDEVEELQIEELRQRTNDLVICIDEILQKAERARLMANGAKVAMIGPVNAGKSSLLNAICGIDRALVADCPGTTRDFIEIELNLEGLPVTLIDTAGLRADAQDQIESMGMAKTRQWVDKADLVCLVFGLDNISGCLEDPLVCDLLHNSGEKPILAVFNKADLFEAHPRIPEDLKSLPHCVVSALTGSNVENLTLKIRQLLLNEQTASARDGITPPNLRQATALKKTKEYLQDYITDLTEGQSCDCCLTHLDLAANELGQILSLAPEDELLDKIFSQFCIGK